MVKLSLDINALPVNEFGFLAERPAESADSPMRSGLSVCWRPGVRTAHYLKEGFSWDFELGGGANTPQVIPTGGFDLFTQRAFAVGQAAATETVPSAELLRDEILWFLYRHLLSGHDWYKNRFTSAASLRDQTDPVERMSPSLLGRLGLPYTPEERPWTVTGLCELGRRTGGFIAREEPTSGALIAAGLYELAKRNPLDVRKAPPPARRNIVRGFVCTAGRPHLRTCKIVFARFRKLLYDRCRKPGEYGGFEDWYAGSASSLVWQIHRIKPEVPRPAVREALAALGWHGFVRANRYVAVGTTVLAGLLAPYFDQDDQRRFAALYGPQSALGGLVAATFAERAALIRRAIYELTSKPTDSTTQGAVLRVMQWYGEMTPARRKIDRAAKAKERGNTASKATPARGRVGPAKPWAASDSQVGDWDTGTRDVYCACPTSGWVTAVESAGGSRWTIRNVCSGCGKTDEHTVEAAELIRQFGPALLRGGRRPGGGP